MSIFTSAQAFQQTRHARRLYVGGIPPNYTDEEELKLFLNTVISKGLNEENDSSFVLSIYINQKKCFAFIELRSIELATACLALDGIIFKKVPLKVLRANEYKPELIPPSLTSKPLVLDLSSFAFGNSGSNPSSTKLTIPPDLKIVEGKIDSIIKFTPLVSLEPGALTVIGYPFDGNNQRDSLPKVAANGVATTVLASKGCASTPRYLRNQLKKYKFGSLENPEYEVDMTNMKIMDIGDVIAGKTPEESLSHLTTVVEEVARLGGSAFYIGGSCDIFSAIAGGLLKVTGDHGLGAIVISAHMRDLQDETSILLNDSCVSHVRLAAQGSLCTADVVSHVQASHGKIIWLSKDIRGQGFVTTGNMEKATNTKRALNAFFDALNFVSEGCRFPKPIMVALDMSAACSGVGGSALSGSGPQGLNTEELLEIAMAAGADSRVIALAISDFQPGQDDTRDNLMLSEIFYRFAMGVTTRTDSLRPISPHPASSVSNISLAAASELLSFSLYSGGGGTPPSGSNGGGLDSNRSSANMSQTSSTSLPTSGDRGAGSLRAIMALNGGMVNNNRQSLNSYLGLDFGSTTADNSASSSIRLSANGIPQSEDNMHNISVSRSNSYVIPSRVADAGIMLNSYQSGEDNDMHDVSNKHLGRKMEPININDGLVEHSAQYAQYNKANPSNTSARMNQELELLDSLLPPTEKRSNNSPFYPAAFPTTAPPNYEQRRGGFRLSGGGHMAASQGRVLPRTFSGTSGGTSVSDTYGYEDCEGYYSSPPSYSSTNGGMASNNFALDCAVAAMGNTNGSNGGAGGSGAGSSPLSGDLLPGLRGLLSDSVPSYWKR